MTQRVIKNGYTKFQEKHVKKEVVTHAFPEQMGDNFLGLTSRNRFLSLKFGSLFTRKFLECSSSCLKNACCTNSNSGRFFRTCCFLLSLSKFYSFCYLFNATAKLGRKRAFFHFFLVRKLSTRQKDVPYQSFHTHQG